MYHQDWAFILRNVARREETLFCTDEQMVLGERRQMCNQDCASGAKHFIYEGGVLSTVLKHYHGITFLLNY